MLANLWLPHQKPLYPTHVDYTHPLSQGLVGWWLVNEGSGTVVRDIGPNEFHATTNATWSKNQRGHSLTYDGSSQYSITNTAVVCNSNRLTFSFWIYAEGLTGTKIIMESGNGQGWPWDRSIIIWFIDDTIHTFTSATGGSGSYGEFNFSFTGYDYKWTNVVITFDKTSGYLVNRAFINANEVSLSTTTNNSIGTEDFASKVWYFMARNTNEIRNNGRLDDIRIYNRILSQNEIIKLYSSPYENLVSDIPFISKFTNVSASASLSPSSSPSESPSSSLSPSISPSPAEMTVCWGHDTDVLETVVLDFENNWTGTGTIENSGVTDIERLVLDAGQSMVSNLVHTGTRNILIDYNVYREGSDILLEYRHAATPEDCLEADWVTYVSPFLSLGYIQVRVTSTL